MNKKLLYSAPEAELLFIKFEENILSGPGSANDGFQSENDLGGLGDDDD